MLPFLEQEGVEQKRQILNGCGSRAWAHSGTVRVCLSLKAATVSFMLSGSMLLISIDTYNELPSLL